MLQENRKDYAILNVPCGNYKMRGFGYGKANDDSKVIQMFCNVS